MFHVSLTPGGAARIVQGAAQRCTPAYQGILLIVRRARHVAPHETSWKINAALQWLWTFVCRTATLYVIRPSRGQDVLDEVLGLDYAGQLTHDGWAPYAGLTRATHQPCLAHLMRRAHDLLEQGTPATRWFPRRVQELLQEGLGLRDRWRRTRPGPRQRARGREGLDQKLESLLRRRIRDPANRRFADHLARYADQMFTFLEHPGMEATDHWAERAIRPAVVNRKVFGGNRTEAGARAQEILCSVLRTCQQRGGNGFEYLAHVLRVPFCLGRPMSPIALPAS